MILSDLSEEEAAAVDVEEEDTEGDPEEAEDLVGEADGVEEGDQAAAPSQEFVPFSCPKVSVCVESANGV